MSPRTNIKAFPQPESKRYKPDLIPYTSLPTQGSRRAMAEGEKGHISTRTTKRLSTEGSGVGGTICHMNG